MVSLLRQIMQSSPQIEILKMNNFSADLDREENIGEIVLETLLSSNIESITDLDLSHNASWFHHPDTK